ncbi:nuclear transport factor 2 family protein [Rhizorhabdus histidinilytica]
MSSGQDSADTVKRFFDAFNAGDIAAAFATLSPDIEWTYHGPRDRIPSPVRSPAMPACRISSPGSAR